MALLAGPDATVTTRIPDGLNRTGTRLRRAGQVSERPGSCGVPRLQAKQAASTSPAASTPCGLAPAGNVNHPLDGCPQALDGTGRRTNLTLDGTGGLPPRPVPDGGRRQQPRASCLTRRSPQGWQALSKMGVGWPVGGRV